MRLHLAFDGAKGMTSGTSTSGALRWELRDQGETPSIWISANNDKVRAVKLCETEGWGNQRVFISPTDNWIIVQDGGASMGLHLRHFRMKPGCMAEEITKCNIEDLAVRAALDHVGLGRENVLDHVYTRFVDWRKGGQVASVSLSARGSTNKHAISITEFTGDFDLLAGTFKESRGQRKKIRKERR